jgi:hypothetical protein
MTAEAHMAMARIIRKSQAGQRNDALEARDRSAIYGGPHKSHL